MSSAAPYVIVVQLRALPAWLALDRPARQRVIAEHVEPILAAHADTCRTRWVDVESFTATCSDLLIADVGDPLAWNRLWEAVRDTPLFAVPYFAAESILMGVEDGYRDYERTMGDA